MILATSSSTATLINAHANVKPFDAHNHIQLSSPVKAIDHLDDALSGLCGVAIMSTHPRDYDVILDIRDKAADDNSSSSSSMRVVPCLGVHPWFLHELSEDDWTMVENDDDNNNNNGAATEFPKWVIELESYLKKDPTIVVGEIGLDNFHFDYATKELTTPLEKQIDAFQYQLELATLYERPVSVHCVRAIGPIMDSLQRIHKKFQRLPPRIYFHAFGGKAATVTQLIKTLEKPINGKNKKKTKNEDDQNDTTTTTSTTKLYFGFAPIINFDSPKTMDVIRAVGMDRLVLETDHEDIWQVEGSMKVGIEKISHAFGLSAEELIFQTNQNVQDLYSIQII
jgi:TatD DNase family protein